VKCHTETLLGGGKPVVPLFLSYHPPLLPLPWPSVLLPLTCPRQSATPPPMPAPPRKPKRKRATEPQAFAGLPHKPPCALCERETGETPPAPPHGPLPCRSRPAAPVPWTPRCTFVPTPSVPIAAGWG